jgi:RNA polymerase sigma factor (sigma-70 family)
VARRFRTLSSHVDDLWQELCGRVFCPSEPMMPDNIEAYCMRIMQHLALDRRHALSRRREVPLSGSVTDTALERAEERADLRQAIASLPPREKAALELRLAGYTARETAASLQVSVATVERRWSSALAQLRQQLLGSQA